MMQYSSFLTWEVSVAQLSQTSFFTVAATLATEMYSTKTFISTVCCEKWKQYIVLVLWVQKRKKACRSKVGWNN